MAVFSLGGNQALSADRSHVPFDLPYYTFTKQSDIVYGQAEVLVNGPLKDMLLDLYIPNIPPPANGVNKLPLMIMLHGGGFAIGSKEQGDVVPYAQEYAMRGWLVASINYRLQGDIPVPSSRVQTLFDSLGGDASASSRDRARVAAIDDTLMALDFLRQRNDVKAIWTTLWGSSSGGNTVLGVGYALDDYGISRPIVASVVEVSGRFDGLGSGNPFDDPAGSDPVLMTIIGTDDVNYLDSVQTRNWANAAGLPQDYQSLFGVGHSPDLFNNNAIQGVSLYQRSVDWHHETVFDGLNQGPQPPSGC